MKKKSAWFIVIRIAGWLWFLAFPLVFLNAGNNSDNVVAVLANATYWRFILCYFIIYYLNSLVLVPKLFLRKKYTAYTLVVLLMFAGVSFYQPFDRLLANNHFEQPRGFNHPPDDGRPMPDFNFGRGSNAPGSMPPPPGNGSRPFGGQQGQFDAGRPQPPPPGGGRRVDVVSIFIFIMIIALGTAVEITRQWVLTERRATIAEAGRANAELSFLKAQINPHFLFNTLNNIYTLAIAGSKYTPDSIMKLSNIMRYVTDEVSADFVPLEHEMECIENYIDLQRLRIGKQTEIVYTADNEIHNRLVPPLVLMTFVENVFKYGISKKTANKLVIDVSVTNERIRLYCQNPIHQITTDVRTGVGIKNARQRLQHLYPAKHTLKISHTNNLYTVELILYT